MVRVCYYFTGSLTGVQLPLNPSPARRPLGLWVFLKDASELKLISMLKQLSASLVVRGVSHISCSDTGAWVEVCCLVTE